MEDSYKDKLGTKRRKSVVEEIRNALAEDISSGGLEHGDKLGSERDLSERFGASRTTVRLALAALEEAGLVHRTLGRSGGTFVGPAKIRRETSTVQPVPVYLARQGYTSGARVIRTDLAAADAATAEALGIEPGALVQHLHRIVYADNIAFSIEHGRVRADLAPGLLEQPLGGAIYPLLEEVYGIQVEKAEETLELVHASEDNALQLGVDVGAPLFLVNRVSWSQNGEPFEYSTDLFRADLTQIKITSLGEDKGKSDFSLK